MLEQLKTLLRITDDAQDAYLGLILKITENKVLPYVNQDNIPLRLKPIVVEMAADAYYLMKGASGNGAGEITGSVSGLSDNGQSWSFRDSAYNAVLSTVSDSFLKDYAQFLDKYRKPGW